MRTRSMLVKRVDGGGSPLRIPWWPLQSTPILRREIWLRWPRSRVLPAFQGAPCHTC
jgi:hypothetical protein